jgi:hypothetical protein
MAVYMRRRHELKVIIVANGELGVICGVCVCVCVCVRARARVYVCVCVCVGEEEA